VFLVMYLLVILFLLNLQDVEAPEANCWQFAVGYVCGAAFVN